jgi:hypothetical protein
MNSSINRSFHLVFFAVLVGGCGMSAWAQQPQFHLPFEAKWGGRVLPAGDYTVRVPDRSLNNPDFLVNGSARVGFIVPLTAGVNEAGESASLRDHLRLVEVDGKYFVKEYKSALTGTTYYFKTPRFKERRQAGKAQPLDIQASR